MDEESSAVLLHVCLQGEDVRIVNRALSFVAGRTRQAEYLKRVADQVRQYEHTEDMHALPPICQYWLKKHLYPRYKEVLGTESFVEFYATHLLQYLSSWQGEPRFLSLGAGDCSYEIDIVQEMIKSCPRNFRFTCTDISSTLLAKGYSKAKDTGLLQYISFLEVDVNKRFPPGKYCGVMASWALHHLVELEYIFDRVREAIAPSGVFLSFDAIGRNGHMCWPETLDIINSIWRFLPDSKKYHHQLRRLQTGFVNWDCSKEGFEGIRSQDILTNLIKRFDFAKFLAYGGLTEVFTSRGFGPNYDADNSDDLAFIDSVETLNVLLIDNGIIKPTQMGAVMTLNSAEHKCFHHWTPEFCVRPV